MMGKGLVYVEGLEWIKHKRIINPAFSVEKLKVMVKRMAACAISMLEEWKDLLTMSKDGSIMIEMNVEFQKLTADIIAHIAFGSNYMQGNEVFEA
ncbi:hypothetical protein SLEP1_g4497 [Rubroshorea leprosula]|uniref:Cytochrome P450 n=1 Tax=Rubroshorea leprosula TaxID=152421 RepID=A0AAV5HXQ4_9ROSI|nr:hypothetical protein SLEP1_g4497 [Rubroshorea leprosula]